MTAQDVRDNSLLQEIYKTFGVKTEVQLTQEDQPHQSKPPRADRSVYVGAFDARQKHLNA